MDEIDGTVKIAYGLTFHGTITEKTFLSFFFAKGAEVIQRNNRILELEKYIRDHGLEVPEGTEVLQSSVVPVSDALKTSRARSSIASGFLNKPELGDVLISVDSDIKFTAEDIGLLVTDCLEKKSVIGGIYVTDAPDGEKPFIPFVPLGSMEERKTFSFDKNELTEVRYVSSGFMAIHRSVLEALMRISLYFEGGNFYDFFSEMWIAADDGKPWHLSEDWAFCEKARRAGFKIWIEPLITVGHVKTRVLTVDDL